MRLPLTLLFLFGTTWCIAQQPPNCEVRRIHLYTGILERGGNPAYKPSGDTIVYQKNVFNFSSFVLCTEVFLSDTAEHDPLPHVRHHRAAAGH